MARQIRPGQLQENVLYNISASYAISASHEIVKEVSSSYADTASYVNPLNQQVIIEDSNTGELLRVTQTGTGDAIRIEDSTNPDATPTVITKDGDMYIGSSSAVSTGGGVTPKLYIKNGSSGYTGNLAIDTAMLFEGAGSTYFATLSPDAFVSGLYMGSPSDIFGAFIRWGYNAGRLQLGAAQVGHGIEFTVGNKSATSMQLRPDVSATGDYNATLTVTGSVIGTQTASFGTYIGDGSQLSGISTTPFPFIGDAVITGSLIVSGSNTSLISLPDAPNDSIIISGSNNRTRLHIYDSEENNTPTYTEGAGIKLTGGDGTGQATLEIAAVGSNNGGNNNEQTFIHSNQMLTLRGNDNDAGANLKFRGSFGGINFNSSTAGTSLVYFTNGGSTRSTIALGTTSGNANDGVALSARSSGTDFTIVAGGNTWLAMSSTKATFIADVSSSATSTASFGTYIGDGSQLSGISTTPFPFIGDAVITGSLIVSGSNLTSGFRTDTRNVILGYGAGNNQDPTNGPFNVMIGYESGYTNTIGDSNVCIGQYAGYALSTNASDENIFIGKLAGAGGTSPVARMSDANWNIGLGNESLLFLTSGDYNIGFGHRTMRNISTGQQNIGLGRNAIYNVTSGDNNIGIGYNAGVNQTTGDGNITIGSGSLGIAGESNQLRIGNGNTLTTISASLETGDVIIASTASAQYLSTPAGNLSSISASYALTASHALNAGGGGAGFPFTGDAVITGSLVVSASATSQSLSVQGSGSTVFDVIGSVGTLFSIDDDLNGMLFTANDISGFPVLQASASGDVFIGKSPQSLYTTTVISSTTAATTHSLCTLSTSSYDGAFFEYTAQSASNARAGNIMSTWNGTDIVYAETTTADIGRTTDLTTEVIISGSTARLVAYGPNAGYKIKTIIKAI